ncbi:hypothetical protein F7725_027658 [Dissostichus mawsoni]|uniref:Protein-glutamine gamma-glutamyltransferase K n=1 Tax=Dissostichus mawsoni TaxID=36200 RepID=A0A7J5XDL5_DISMA|nr:hypothetical protein F7725_027658 [Dissostichus mawsoni]
MPVSTRSIRDRSAVGRFPTVTFGFGEDTEEEKEASEEDNAEQGNAGQKWLRKICPCCCPQPDDVDITDTLITETLATDTDDLDKEEGTDDKKPDAGDSELDALLLNVKSIDLMKGKSGENRTQHHTDLYQSDAFIIRRGQNFHMWITLSRPFDPSTDKLHLNLKTGPLPTVSKGTHVIIPLVEELEGNRWEASIVSQDDKRMKLSVNTLPTALISRYQIIVETHCANGQAVSTHDPANDILMLFNPWCEDDTVFMDAEDERQEYVLNDIGKIYYGTMDQIGVRTWDYGQFQDGILAACIFVLEKSGTPPSGWGDPINVVRVISAMINSPDDLGVVEGDWSGNYSAGTSPTVWSGSVEILKEYHKNDGNPVKYGQCWVFAGVFTTGIPSRTVTNFSSAHDTDVSLTTDVYLDESLEPMELLNADSIWNFHVWNDAWMVRPDLPAGNGGWQAVDATPQETSQGTFRCGPASLTAVRNGQVNSDKIYWQKNTDGTFSQIYSEKKVVGHFISTKAVGTDERMDITHLYKHPEGTEMERIAVETACSYGSKAEAYTYTKSQDVSVEVTMDGEGPKMGEDAELKIILRNSSSEERKLILHSQVAVMYYTGVHKATVKKDTTDLDLMPNEEKLLEWTMEYKDYKDQLVDQAALMLTLTGRVKETQQVLKAVIFHVEGLGLLTARKIHYGDIGSRASVSLSEHFVSTLPGPRKLLASLDCKQLTQVHGVTDITVEEKSNGAL